MINYHFLTYRYADMGKRGEGLEALVHLFLINHARFHAEGIFAFNQELAGLQLHHLHRGLHIYFLSHRFVLHFFT